MAVVLLAAFSYAFTPLRASQDEWWHLKTGKWIWEHRALPTNDIFTYTGENMRWYNHEWLSQLLFYAAFMAGKAIGVGSITGLVLFKSLVVVGTFGLVGWLVRLRGAAWPAVILITFLAAEISRRTIYPRPPIFSYLLLAVFLLILYHWKQGRLKSRWLWILPALTVLWANLHGMVLLAIVAVGAFAAGETIELVLGKLAKARVSRVSADKNQRAVKMRVGAMLWLLLALTVVAAMVQPSGYHLFFLGSKFTADPALNTQILEMRPPPFFVLPNGDSYAFVPGFAGFWFAAALLLLLLVWNRLRFPYAADYLLAGFFLYQGAMHWRLLPLFAIGAAAPAGALLAELGGRISIATRRIFAWGALALSLLLSAGFVFLVDENGTFFQRNLQLVRGETMSLDDYPAPLLDFILAADLPDRMYSESNYCGYFMWRLSPEKHKLFTDNRFDLFGSKYYVEEKIILTAGNKGDRFGRDGVPFEKSWQQLLDEHGVNFVVLHRDPRPPPLGLPLPDALLRSGKWTDIYYYTPPGSPTRPDSTPDPKAGISVWLRNDPKYHDVQQRALELFKRENPHLPTPQELDAQLMLDPAVARNNQPAAPTTNWRIPTGT